MPTHGLPGEIVLVSLQTGVGKGAGANTFFTNPVVTYGVRFVTSFLNTLVFYSPLYELRTNAVSLIHSSLVNPQGLLSITILLACDQTFQLLGAYYYKHPGC